MSPKEFKAVQRGYQLQLADQRHETITARQIPQRTASPDAVNNAVLDQLYETLTQRNDELIDKLNKADQPAKLSNKQQLFIQLLQQGKEDNS